MLRRLDEVDWARHRDAYGAAARIPEFLRALASGDAAEREAAIDDLYAGLCHQG